MTVELWFVFWVLIVLSGEWIGMVSYFSCYAQDGSYFNLISFNYQLYRLAKGKTQFHAHCFPVFSFIFNAAVLVMLIFIIILSWIMYPDGKKHC